MKKVLLLLLALILCCSCVSPASAWLSGFDYQKDLIFSSTYPTTLNSYQVKVIVWNTTGTDSGQNVYLNGHLAQPTTWNDIRFTTTTDAICDIWIQEQNTSAAIIWVEVPYIYNGQTTVRCYYGKSVATAVSDGDATFRFWGTFQQLPLNPDKWTSGGNYTLYTDASNNTVADIWMNGTSGESYISTLDAFNYATGYEQVIRAKLTQYPASLIGLYTSDSYYAYFGMSREVNNSLITETRIAPGTGNSQETIIGQGYGGAFHIWKIKRDQTGTSCLFTIDNVAVANHTSKVPTAAMPMSFRATAINGEVIVDYAFTKKYVSPEPLLSYTNPEHANGTPNTDFEGSPTFGPVGTTVYFTDLTSGVHSTWNWSFGDGGTSTLQAPNHTYTSTGTYDVTLVTTNIEGSDTQVKQDYIYIYSAVPATTANIPSLLLAILILVDFGLIIYALLDNERIFGAIIAALIAVILSFYLGMVFVFGGGVDAGTAFKDAPVGWFFIFVGVVMVLVMILLVLSTRYTSEEGDDYE
jgi:PKD repeat protein